MTSMINWYRFLVRYRVFHPQPLKPITVPLLVLFGMDDMAINPDLAQAGTELPLSTNGKFVPYEGISHWIQHEAPEKVNNDILKFIQ